jgi:hypothetical protein
MSLVGQNIDDGKDSEMKEPFAHHYSNIDSLQWLLKKKSLLKDIVPNFLRLPK